MEGKKTVEKSVFQDKRVEQVVLSAVMLAVASVLILFPIWTYEQGGSVTLFSMLPVLLLSRKYGVKWGLFSGFVFSVLQLVLGGFGTIKALSAGYYVIALLMDYVVAFTVLGLGGLMRKSKYGMYAATTVALSARFICHFVSGWVVWGDYAIIRPIWLHSIVYNAKYMVPELVLTLIAVTVVLKTKVLDEYFSPQLKTSS